MDTAGNNGLVVGAKGATAKRVEAETGARVECQSDRTTVVLQGTPVAVGLARVAVERLLRERGIAFRGWSGGGAAPVSPSRSSHRRDSRDFVGEGAGAGAGGDLRGQLKRGRDARVATEVDEGSRKHRKGPDDAFEDAGGAIEGSKNGGSDANDRVLAELEKMRSRAERFGLPPPTIADAECTLGIGGGDGGMDASRPPRATTRPRFPLRREVAEIVVDCGGKAGLGRVLGRNKATLAALREATGLRFEVDNDAKRVTIAGDRDAIAVAANLVASVANVQFGQHPTTENVARAFADAGGVRHRPRAPEPGLELASPPGESGNDGVEIVVDTGDRLGIIIGKRGKTISALMKRSGCDMICDQEKKTVRVVGRNREVAAAGERLILDILADARAKRASAKDAADVGEDGDARDDDRGGDDDYGEGGAENRAGESPEKTKPAKDAEEDAENITAKGTEAKAEAEADADDDADAKVGAGDANEADAKGGRARTRRRAVAAVAAEGADADADADADAAVARTNERGREEDVTVQDDPRRCDGSGVTPSARYWYT